ncbi:MAG: hypothetical protein FWD84_01740 [Oscillospiraceae bacterium]|nr:hypothetical protein [Oscillospiraceae bacterium]
MIRFFDKKAQVERIAYSIEDKSSSIYNIRFLEHGIPYSYLKSNITLLSNVSSQSGKLLIYEYEKGCYSCKNSTKIKTYILHEETCENLIFPWDKHYLNRTKSAEAHNFHFHDSSIEFYPVSIIGTFPEYDQRLLAHFRGQIGEEYSVTQGRTYPMNLCRHCNAKQGQFFIYRDVNIFIQKMQDIPIVAKL